MRPLQTRELLTVWENSLNKPLPEKVLMLLTAACPEMDPASIAQWSIGERDRGLLQLREWMFGSRLVNTSSCPQCMERVEWESRVADIRMKPSHDRLGPTDFELEHTPYDLRFRLPTSLDVAAVIQDPDNDTAPQDLIKKCIVSCRHSGEACDADKLPRNVLAALGRKIEALDPQADIRIDLTCPQCSNQWEVLFDIASYLWSEINNWAERTLIAVHKLGRAYGWTEQDVLNLSPMRRQLYLGLAYQ